MTDNPTYRPYPQEKPGPTQPLRLHRAAAWGARKIPALMARLSEKGIDIMGLDVRAMRSALPRTPRREAARGNLEIERIAGKDFE